MTLCMHGLGAKMVSPYQNYIKVRLLICMIEFNKVFIIECEVISLDNINFNINLS